MRPRVKICGLCRAQDVDLALALGADDCGFVLAPDSPRAVTPAALVALARRVLERGRRPVLVCRGIPAREVATHAAAAAILAVQMHGATGDDRALLAAAGCAAWQVLSVTTTATELPTPTDAPSWECPAVLDVGTGGTGTRFPWRLLGTRAPAHTFIAGGIAHDNVVELLRHRPFGIDVSSGIEARPGGKDETRLRALFDALNHHAR